MSVAFTDLGATSWVEVSFVRASGRGKVVPQLLVALEARTTSENLHVEIHSLAGRLSYENETISESTVGFRPLSHWANQLDFPFFLTRDALGHINNGLKADTIELTIDFSGLMRVYHDSSTIIQYASSPPAGEWSFLPVGLNRMVQLRFQISRSDWFKHVLEPLGNDEYVLNEIRVPKGDVQKEWQSALDCLRQAEYQFTLGHDPEVFFQCRAALESLPGAPKQIFKTLRDEGKREVVDQFVRQFVEYLHFGRHVDRAAPTQGFRVHHQDAEFALAVTKMLLSYTSKLID
jgi:hypothetical protein